MSVAQRVCLPGGSALLHRGSAMLAAALLVIGAAVPCHAQDAARAKVESRAAAASDAAAATDGLDGVGLQMVAAVQQAVIDAIGAAEKSVVSIARVAEPSGTADVPGRDRGPNVLGLARPHAPQPTDPDFIPTAYATGVILDTGLVLTCHHALVLDEPSKLYVTTVSGKAHPARVKAADPRSDLAVVEVIGDVRAEDFPPIRLGDAGTLRKGQIVIALGNPFAIARDGQASASWGIVANLQRKAPPAADDATGVRRDTLHHYGTLIQTDAKLNLGTSGGALVNLKGEMVGLTTSLAAVAGYEQAAGYAIPVDDTFRRAIERLKQGREVEYGLLGVHFPRDRLFGVRGAQVGQMLAGGPASQAEIMPNDVIVRVDDHAIRDTDDAMLHIGKLPAGGVARITLERNGRTLVREVTLAKFPVQPLAIATSAPPSWRGLTVDYATALPEYQGRVALGEVAADASVVVRDVVDGSPAAKAGLRRGMLIRSVRSTRVDSPDEFYRLVNDKGGDVALRLAPSGGVPAATVTVPAE